MHALPRELLSCVSTRDDSRDPESDRTALQLLRTVDMVGRAVASRDNMCRITPRSDPHALCSASRVLGCSQGACVVPRIISNT